ncbi:alpha/beta family hydrolase [Cellulomonas sp. S1-8]|uniref:alpha/beta hydrolase family protein n=1 Tax=Cellulomonas sp. S1-8 TaxID=2904790 RepID=UPI002242F8F5|nr:alpha/beta family hydrolase [Cellulomonas sp. S1-8]UZN02785.1 dienelactone hydrolase [Cellulomonas sp. S1-8]
MADVRVLRAGSGPVDVAGVLLTPGAGATRDNRTLVVLDAALAAVGVPVRRVDLPRGAAAAPARVRDEAGAFAAELGVPTGRLVIGGRSFGGRMCSMAVADGLPVAGLLLLSYPLHPPGKPETLRVEHLPRVDVPVLAVSGASDPFGTPDELAAHLASLAGPTTLVVVPGTHGPADAPVVAAVRAWLT